jgi:hypothetical protein
MKKDKTVVLTLELPERIAQMIENDPDVKARVQEWLEAKFLAEESKKRVLDNLLSEASTLSGDIKDVK